MQITDDGMGASRWAAVAGRWRPAVGLEWLALGAALWFALANNELLWRAMSSHGSGLGQVAGVFVIIVAAQALLFCLLLVGPLARPLLTLLLLAGAAAGHVTQAYGVLFDAGMLRNVLVTEFGEAREQLTPDFFAALAGALPAIVAVWWVRLRERTLLRAAATRAVWMVALSGVLAAALWTQYWSLSSLIRSEPQLRHAIAPANLVAAAYSLARKQGRSPPGPMQPVGRDALVEDAGQQRLPRALVLVVGETVRAQNWGLSGYARQTTPELARRDVLNMADVTACGTATEVSLPCMFSLDPATGHDPALARRSESLLHVLSHAGIAVQWRDNQTGCKGACDGLPYESLAVDAAARCELGRCLDDGLFEGLEQRIMAADGDVVIVLHMLGNHGPAYSQRYPQAFSRFLPACESLDLVHCSPESIRNAYDNALLYTDHLLADAIDRLGRMSGHATALVYVSDHGESLGESGLYLHGMPRQVAPLEQIKVPMLWWRSANWQAQDALDSDCLSARARMPASHDDFPHSILGLMRVRSSAYVPERDLFSGCRSASG